MINTNSNTIHKLPSSLVDLFDEVSDCQLLGFGKSKEQQNEMLLLAVLRTKNKQYVVELHKDIAKYYIELYKGISKAS